MGYLYNPSAVIVGGDSNKLSLSVWLRIPSSSSPDVFDTSRSIGFIEWARIADTNNGGPRIRANRFYITYNSVGSGIGNNLWYPGGFIWGKERERSPGDGGDPVLFQDSFGFGTTPFSVSSVGGMQTDTWYHYAVAMDVPFPVADVGNPTGIGSGGSGDIPQLLNGVQINVSGGNAGWGYSVTGAVRPVLVTQSGLRMDGNNVYVPWNTEDATGESGGELWHNKLDIADFQLWHGQYIDWTVSDNFSQLVTVSGGVGRPASTIAAANAFGEQTILFKGRASDHSFDVNRGTCGDFTRIGSASDFSPGPSY